MNFTEAKMISKKLNSLVDAASDEINSFSRNDAGLVSDEVRSTAAYKAATQGYGRAFQVLRKFNASYVKAFKKELREERSRRFAEL